MPSDAPNQLAKGRYQLTSRLGTGSMSSVYQAKDTKENTTRAIKLLSPMMARSDLARARFLQELEMMVRLKHPHIARVYAGGVEKGRPYMVLELLTGGTLTQRSRMAGPFPPIQAATLMGSVLQGLAHAHRHGIVHRDIKPDNILLDGDNQPKVIDFGIARDDESSNSITRTGVRMGTQSYMAPEQQIDAKHVGPAADIYASGATLFAIVTGMEPPALYIKRLNDESFSNIPAPLAGVIHRATRENEHERYLNASEMARALYDAVHKMGGPKPPALQAPLPIVPRARSMRSRTPIIATLAICLAALAAWVIRLMA